MSETLELTGRLRAETNVDLAAVVVNRVLPELFGRGEEEVFDRLATPAAEARLAAALGGPIAADHGGGSSHRDACAARGPNTSRPFGRPSTPRVPLLYLPYLFFRSHGLRATHQLADALAGELGY